MKIRDPYSLVVNRKGFVEVFGDTARQLLLKTFLFVFNLEHFHKVRPTYLFESALLDRKEETKKLNGQLTLAEL